MNTSIPTERHHANQTPQVAGARSRRTRGLQRRNRGILMCSLCHETHPKGSNCWDFDEIDHTNFTSKSSISAYDSSLPVSEKHKEIPELAEIRTCLESVTHTTEMVRADTQSKFSGNGDTIQHLRNQEQVILPLNTRRPTQRFPLPRHPRLSDLAEPFKCEPNRVDSVISVNSHDRQSLPSQATVSQIPSLATSLPTLIPTVFNTSADSPPAIPPRSPLRKNFSQARKHKPHSPLHEELATSEKTPSLFPTEFSAFQTASSPLQSEVSLSEKTSILLHSEFLVSKRTQSPLGSEFPRSESLRQTTPIQRRVTITRTLHSPPTNEDRTNTIKTDIVNTLKSKTRARAYLKNFHYREQQEKKSKGYQIGSDENMTLPSQAFLQDKPKLPKDHFFGKDSGVKVSDERQRHLELALRMLEGDVPEFPQDDPMVKVFMNANPHLSRTSEEKE